MTEGEAKTKWCPMVRIADCGSNNSVACNRYAHKEVNLNCIGSECMAWRWKLTPSEAANINAQSNAQARANGYCGAFGKP